MLKSLLDRGRVLARAHSVQLAAIGVVLSTLFSIDPVALQAGWQSMPPELRALIPANVATWITGVLFALVIVARALPQKAVTERLGLLGSTGGGSTFLAPAWLAAAKAPVARTIDGIVIHCSATREGQDVSAATIRSWHLAQKWADIGYHFVVRLDGTIEAGRPLARIGAHVAGHNATTIGICYVGGVAANGRTPKDTRTIEQRQAMIRLLMELRVRFPSATIKGHRDYSPDRSGNGRIEQAEWIKACPSFDAATEYAAIA